MNDDIIPSDRVSALLWRVFCVKKRSLTSFEVADPVFCDKLQALPWSFNQMVFTAFQSGNEQHSSGYVSSKKKEKKTNRKVFGGFRIRFFFRAVDHEMREKPLF